MKLIVGLGNIKYPKTRHNLGYNVIDTLIAQRKLEQVILKNYASNEQMGLMTSYELNKQTVTLFKPTWGDMNSSGMPLKFLMDVLDIHIHDLIVVYDDMDLELGQLRIRQSGKSGGHNGVESIIKKIGSDFTRIRLGIDKPFNKSETLNWVLGEFEPAEKKIINDTIIKATEAVEYIINNNTDDAMSRYNGSLI